MLFFLTRKEGQGTQDELREKNFRAELEERERQYFESKAKERKGMGGSRIFKLFYLSIFILTKKKKRFEDYNRETED